MSSIPSQVSESTRKRNPHLYGGEITAVEIGKKMVPLKNGIRIGNKPRKAIEERLNKTEKRFLSELRSRGHYDAEPWRVKLRLANGIHYTADFYVPKTLGRPTLFEVKGNFIRQAGYAKLKQAASLFPEFRFIKAQWSKGQWTEEEIKP